MISRSALLLALFTAVAITRAQAGKATWNLDPLSNNWNTAENWTPATVPNGPDDVARFEVSNTTSVSLSSPINLDRIEFGPASSAFTIEARSASISLDIVGAGIINESGQTQEMIAAIGDAGTGGLFSFSGNATAGSLTSFLLEGAPSYTADLARVEFHEFSTAGDAFFRCFGGTGLWAFGGKVAFYEYSGAGNAVYILEGAAAAEANSGGIISFSHASSADHANITLNGTLISGGNGAYSYLEGSSTASNATFILNGGEASEAEGGEVVFWDSATAEEATLILQGGSVAGALGGEIYFHGDSSAGNATIIVKGGEGEGGYCAFTDFSDGGTARIQLLGNGTLYLSLAETGPVTIGSIEGDGIVLLWSGLSVGSNNLSTVFSGTLTLYGRLRKQGTGTLTLTGANTHAGGVVVKEGAVLVNNRTGSGTGSGPVEVHAGSLGGRGTVAGPVTVGSGSGPEASLEPGFGLRRPRAFIIRSSLTFKPDGNYTCKLNTREAVADQVRADGVTIESGAHFEFIPVANKPLPAGQVFTVISNASADPIAGEFANLPDNSTFTSGRNTFQVDYQGGDGNDLILTVVP